jgi:hypothetical protein
MLQINDCHGLFIITSASRHAKNFASATIAKRYDAVAQRGLALRSLEQGQLFSEEQILGHEGSLRGKRTASNSLFYNNLLGFLRFGPNFADHRVALWFDSGH